MMTMELPQFTVSGTREEMGRQYGELCRDLIHGFVEGRVLAVEAYFAEAGHRDTRPLFESGAACLEQVREFDPEGYVEHLNIAEGAGIDPVTLFTAANMTDVRDIVLLPASAISPEDEGCTAALVPPSLSLNGSSLQGQTWDLNEPDVKYVIALHQVPESGPEVWTVTCAGCQTLMGMNEHGVTVGTTNLKTKGAQVGIPYLSVLHLALRQGTREAASEIVERALVAGSHSYWVGDGEGAIEWERSPLAAYSRTTGTGPLARSNHCLFDENISKEAEVPESTHVRLTRMQELLEQSDQHTPQSLMRIFANRSDGRLSINRYAEDQSGGTTNAVVVCNPAELEMLACRGQADIGAWVKLGFARA